MLIAREILNMFEFSRNQKIALSVDNHFNECHSVGTPLYKPLEQCDNSVQTFQTIQNTLIFVFVVYSKAKYLDIISYDTDYACYI